MKNLNKRIKSAFPQFHHTDGYYYRGPDGGGVQGFCVENATSGLYLWTFALPLYEPWKFFHLGFGHRYVFERTDALSADDTFSSLVDFIWLHLQRDGDQFMVERFVSSTIGRDIRDPRMTRALGSSLFYLGDFTGAATHYEKALEQASDPRSTVPEFSPQTKHLLDLISGGDFGSVEKVLDGYKRASMVNLHIP